MSASPEPLHSPQQVTVLGATGSIGCSTLDVIARHPDRFSLFALTGHTRIAELAEQCRRHQPRYAVVPDAERARDLRERLNGSATEVLDGESGLAEVAAAAEVDVVMASIVGAAGLAPTLAAAHAGKRVLLANKEALVMAGDLFLGACQQGGAEVLPIDSEHNAVFQCLPADRHRVRRIILTASGGPFRDWTLAQMEQATPDQACAHPNWSMGRKISVDSATMMNKGLELIEAHYLFSMPREGLDILIHPQSIIHSMVEYADGSTLAQLGNPDMRTPIAHALAYPNRMVSGVESLSLAQIGRLDFEAPDLARFECLDLAINALQAEGAAPCVLNAANEVAVQAFLDERIGFTRIAAVNRHVLDKLGHLPAAESIDHVQSQDLQAREVANSYLATVA